MKKALGYIAYEGPSELDGAPIVVIINKVHSASANDKTGDLVQSFIIRSDIAPVEALQTGADASICGDCEHRPINAKKTGKPPCYVNVGRSVRAVYEAYKRGRYERVSLHELALKLAGKKLRIGTYGDGAAAPVSVWQALTTYTAGHVGYTHQWQRPNFDHSAWSKLVMASVDTEEQAKIAHKLGYRTFRVSIDTNKLNTEISCPASAESGKKTTCTNCMLCGGTTKQAKHIVIQDHALGHKRRVINIAIDTGVTA
jgi:hypothetical protein